MRKEQSTAAAGNREHQATQLQHWDHWVGLCRQIMLLKNCRAIQRQLRQQMLMLLSCSIDVSHMHLQEQSAFA